MTDIWKLPNGNYVRRAEEYKYAEYNTYVEYEPGARIYIARHSDLPADAVPMVPESGRQVTGQEIYNAWEAAFAFDHQPEYVQQDWNKAAERLNLRVREPERQPWDVLREAADIVEMATGDNAVEQVAAIRVLERIADRLDAAAKAKSQRDREIAVVADALRDLHGESKSWDHQATVALDALDAVRGEQA